MNKTTKLIRWQRITIVVLFLASLSMAIAAAHQARISKARLNENQQLRQQLSAYETEMRRFRLTPADIEYLQWFQEFDRSCRKMNKQQAESFRRELHSVEEDSLEPVMVAATDQWRQSLSLFQQKTPPPACQALAAAYAERLSLMTGQVQEYVSIQMVISSRGYGIDSPQGRKWAKAPGMRQGFEQRTAEMRRLRATTSRLNAMLEHMARTPGTPLPPDLAKLRVSWAGVFLD